MSTIIVTFQKKDVIAKAIFKALLFMSTLCVCLFVFSNVAFAAIDPVDAVNNMNDYFALFIQAIGGMAILVGVLLLGIGMFTHDPSQKITGGIAIAAGALVAGATFVVQAVIGG